MSAIGYARLIELWRLPVRPLAAPAQVSGAVNRRVDGEGKILFPRGVAIDDTPIGHLEFGLRHEGVNLEVIDAVFDHLSPDDLARRFEAAPNGAPIRRACFLWEWLRHSPLAVSARPGGGYVDLFPDDVYFVAGQPSRHGKFRVRNNALGNADFCPTVRRSGVPAAPDLQALLKQAEQSLTATDDVGLIERALTYLYMSETRSSFAIENDPPSADRQARFVQLLRRAGEIAVVDEDWLVSLQNAVVRDAFSQEASYRFRQNWLEDGTGQITFLPPPPDVLRDAMQGWADFINDSQRGVDALVKVACAAFGFVYLHPFMDGNGRLHRFLIHHALGQAEPSAAARMVPVSAVILKHLAEYQAVLANFSRPTTRLWDYMRADIEPLIIRSPGGRPYRFFDATGEVAFLHKMIRLAVEEEIPRELAWLRGYDQAQQRLQAEFDLPNKDIAALIRMIESNQGILSLHRRKQYAHLPENVLDRIEARVREAFNRD